MKKTKFFILIALAFILFAQNIFAQTNNDELYAGITDSDCKNLAKNFEKINKDLESIGVALDNTEVYTYADYAVATSAIDATLEKDGISGPNPLVKIYKIYLGCSIIAYDKAMGSDPQTKALLESMGIANPFDVYKEMIHTKDFAVIEKNFDVLKVALEIDDSSAAAEPTPKASTKSSGKSSSKKSSKDDNENITDFLKGKIKDKVIDDTKNTIGGWF